MKQEDLAELARQLACPEGDQGVVLGAIMNEQNAFIIGQSISALAPVAGERILEIGLGNGELSMPIVEAIGEGGHYIGLEKSSVLARQASKRFARDSLSYATVQTGDCHQANIENGSLNGVLAVNLLYFIEDIDTLFRNIHGWLRSGGRMVMGIRSPESMRAMPFTQYGFNIRTLNEIKNAMHDAGFINVESDYLDEGVTQLGDLQIPVDSLIIKSLKK